MVTAKISPHPQTLTELYCALVEAQRAAHGEDYCLHHDVIRQAAQDGCTSYIEFGVRQGTTLACAVLAGFRIITGVDRDLKPWSPHEHLFKAAMPGNGCLTVIEDDTRRRLVRCDFLLIDSTHTAPHLREELRVQGDMVQRQILVHDTMAIPALYIELERWVKENPSWFISERETRSVGFTLLRRH